MNDKKVTYVMPKVSVIMRDSGKLSAGMSYVYDYGYAKPARKSLAETLVFGTFSFIGFIITMALFVLSVSLTSYMLVNAANSPTVVHMKTQSVPSDGIEREYYVDKELLQSVDKQVD